MALLGLYNIKHIMSYSVSGGLHNFEKKVIS
jgi:hypothetical protein